MDRRFVKDKKYLIGTLFALALIFGAVYFAWQSERPIEIKFDERGVVIPPEKGSRESQRDYAERIIALQKEIKEMMAKDDVGGETPQETLDLFIEALKAGDTELASQYFVLNKQEQMAKELAIGKEKGSIETFLEYVEKIVGGREIRKGLYRFTVAEEGTAIMSFDLILNESMNVWKIKSL